MVESARGRVMYATLVLLVFTLINFRYNTETKMMLEGDTDGVRIGEIEMEFLNRARGRDPHPLCDANVDLKTKLEVCTLVYNHRRARSAQIGSIVTPEVEWRTTINNTCNRYKVAYKILRFPAEEEDAFFCPLSTLNFSVGSVELRDEFYLSQGVVALPDSVFMLTDVAHDRTHFKGEKYLHGKLKHLALEDLVPEVGMIHEVIDL